MDRKKGNKVEAARLENCTEEVVQLHFFEDRAGLEKALLDVGIMDKDTGAIDLKRLLNMDETPQYIDYHPKVGNNVEKLYTAKGEQAVSGEAINRECNTVDLCWGADGFAYGTHILVARKTVTESMLPDNEDSPLKDSTPFAQLSNPKCDELTMCSSHVLITVNESGVQTGESMLARMKMLDAELTERKVQRPVVFMVDNADRIYDDEVMAFARERQIEIWTEKAKTSHIFQSLDQHNETLHTEYRKAKKLLKARRAKPGIDPKTIHLGLRDFFDIMYQIIFTWCTLTDRKIAWKNVGITEEGLRPDFIDRTHFKTAGQTVVNAVVGDGGGTLMSGVSNAGSSTNAGRAVSGLRLGTPGPGVGGSGGVGTNDDSIRGGVTGVDGAPGGAVNQTTQGAAAGAGSTTINTRSRRLISDGPDLSGLKPLPIPSPVGVRKGCGEYWRFKAMAATEIAQRALAVPDLGPKGLGLMTVEPFKAANAKKRTALSDTSGSFRLNGIEEAKKRKREEEAHEEERKRGVREQREERKTAKETAAELARILWEACSGGECKCEELEEGESCRQLPFRLCSVCQRLKRRDCKVQACLDAGRVIRCIVIPPPPPPPPPPLVVEDVHTIAPTRLNFDSVSVRGGETGVGPWREGVQVGAGGSGDTKIQAAGPGFESGAATAEPPPLVLGSLDG